MVLDLNKIEIRSLSFLDSLEYEITIIIEAQKELLAKTNTLICEMELKLKSKIENELNISNSQKTRQGIIDSCQIIDFYYGIDIQIIDHIHQSYRNSFFISMCTIIENLLKDICKDVKSNFGVIPKGNNKNKSKIGIYYDYLINDVKINDVDLKDLYSKIDYKRNIRNKIVHEDLFCKEIPDIKYLEEFISDTNLFFKNIINSLEQRYKEFNHTS